MLIYLAVAYCGYEYRAIANFIGGMSGSAVSKIRIRMEERIKNKKELYGDLEKLRKCLVNIKCPDLTP